MNKSASDDQTYLEISNYTLNEDKEDVGTIHDVDVGGRLAELHTGDGGTIY